MANGISVSTQIRDLAKAVSTAFAASNLTPEEKAPGQIAITDLPWQAPPLITDAVIDGIPLQGYLDVPLEITAAEMMAFWHETLELMWLNPSRLMRRGVIATGGRAMPRVKVGQRNFRFPMPGGWPANMDDSAGALFSIEVAHAIYVSLPVMDLVQTDSNYYVELDTGHKVGVADGVVIGSTSWTGSVAGMVPDLLTMARGEADYICRFDQLASLRSVLHMHRKRFPNNFEGLDQALQALRLLSLGGHCPDLINEMYVAPLDMMVVRAQEAALREAIETLPEPNMSDRSKLQVLHSLLVPGVISMSSFRQNIYYGDHYPYTLAAGKLEQIETWLHKQYQSRIPADVQKLKG